MIREIAAFFPNAANDHDSARVNLAPWEAPYANDPEAAYRTAPLPMRSARHSIVDCGPTPGSDCWIANRSRISRPASPSSEQAASLLPEKPELPPVC